MSVTIAQLIAAMEEIAPADTAEGWDNVGLVLEGNRPVSRILLALDATQAAAQAAVSGGFDALVTHHPPFIAPVKQLRADDPNTAALLTLARAGSSLYCAHTNLDVAPDGTPAALARALGLPARPLPGQPACLAAYVGSSGGLARLAAQKLNTAPQMWGGDVPVETVCLLPGSGGDYGRLALDAGAQAMLTGEMKYHDALYFRQKGLVIITAGHAQTELPVLTSLRHHLQTRLNDVKLQIYID
ncbi:MAG: Nif3-like dinuclear metal center hexameric protein [Eubacteriales bacterium]|nr:Nif3-like dinuclear metal center hexameric protein [Eubacteriales bacterium]